jgi:hypothetical protein
MCEGDLVDIHDFPETLVSPTHQVKVEDDASVGAPGPVEPGTPEPIEALDAQSKW